jgi:hypothetical protein
MEFGQWGGGSHPMVVLGEFKQPGKRRGGGRRKDRGDYVTLPAINTQYILCNNDSMTYYYVCTYINWLLVSS